MKTIVQLVEKQKEYILEKDKAAKQAVEANIAPVEADPSSASRAYVVGDQLILNDVLYDVTSPISVEDAIIVGTNITAANKLSADIQTLTNNVSVLAKNGAVNLVPNNATTQTINGVTFTVNSDGIVTLNGTATATTELPLYTNTDGSPQLVGKTVKMSGCPSGGGNSTYRLQAYRAAVADGSGGTATDSGDGIEFEWLNNGSGTKAIVKIVINSGQTVSNLVFKPMIADADYSGDYVPYAKPNRELTEAVKGITTTVQGTFTVEPSLTTVSLTYSGFSCNDVLGNIRGIATLREDISESSWIQIGTINKGLTVHQQLPAICITPDDGTKGKSGNTTISIQPSGEVRFNLRKGMVTGDQFGFWATFPM